MLAIIQPISRIAYTAQGLARNARTASVRWPVVAEMRTAVDAFAGVAAAQAR